MGVRAKLGRILAGAPRPSDIVYSERGTLDECSAKVFGSTPLRFRILRPTLFSFGVCAVAYGIAGYATNRDTARYQRRILEPSGDRTYLYNNQPINAEMAMAKMCDSYDAIKDTFARFGASAVQPVGVFKNVAIFDVTRAAAVVTALNCLVYVAWKRASAIPWLLRHFTHHPFSGKSYTLLTVTSSHPWAVHLVMNTSSIWVLPSGFIWLSSADNVRNSPFPEPQSTSVWHMLAFYFSSAVLGNLVSHIYRIVRFRSAARLLPPSASVLTATDHPTLPTVAVVGGSAGVSALIGLQTVAYHEEVVEARFFGEVRLSSILEGFMVFELLAFLRGKGRTDHLGHLAGYAIGALYAVGGPKWWAWVRANTGGRSTPTSES